MLCKPRVFMPCPHFCSNRGDEHVWHRHLVVAALHEFHKLTERAACVVDQQGAGQRLAALPVAEEALGAVIRIRGVGVANHGAVNVAHLRDQKELQGLGRRSRSSAKLQAFAGQVDKAYLCCQHARHRI